ncbi:MAG: hypothetical protein M3Y05_15510 [Gemmatimonadota bacterium]|nr:hypothetical protein [Gemmatimonadota bacterium]
MLAASGDDGRSRDKLLGLFWPEVPQARARHSLGQMLYAIRMSLDKDVFTGVDPIRLNADLLGSDVGDFTDALAVGDLEAAVERYGGSFLDGFYLSDAPEFERWLDAERTRVERSYTDALERLAKRAEGANDSAAGARWRQKLIETDPLSSKHAIGLIRALVDSGDHASALKYAERYEAILGQELGTSVGHAVAELVAEVRAREKTESVVTHAAVRAQETQRPANSPEPTAREHGDAGQSDPARVAVRPTTGRRILRRSMAPRYGVTAFALAALAVLVVVGSWLRPRAAPAHGSAVATSSIAVLPLANVGGDPRDAALVDGLTEELMGVISRIHRLRVVARTSAFVFRNSGLDVRRIADSLRVANILEGSVQRVGESVRVQVRLVDARDGSTRWSETYDRELKDIFAVQSEIATAVAEQLDLQIGTEGVVPRRRPPQNLAAYELDLRGSDPALLRSDSGARVGVQYFRQAIALDPTYASAYARLARMYLRLLIGLRAGTSSRELYAFAENAARRGVALDDSSAETHAALGEMLMARYDLAGAKRELTRAAAIDPSDSRTRRSLATLDYWIRRPADALVEADRAVENDPLSTSANAELARALCANNESAQGLARLKRVEAVRPALLRIPLYTGLCRAMQQGWTAAVAAMRQSREYRGRGFLGYALARAGERQQAVAILTDLIDHSESTHQRVRGRGRICRAG